jgi:very-short-patch-repair endonuclease
MASTRANELIAEQFGPIARRQLLAVGFTSERVRSSVRTGRLHPTRFPGVYAAGRPDLPEEGDLSAALLFAGHGAALTGISCLWWRGYLHRRPDQIHTDTPTRSRSYADLRIRHPRSMDRAWHRGLPITPLATALLAATEHLAHDSLRLVLGRAEFDRGLSLCDLEAALGPGIAGSRKLRRAMDAHLPQLAKCANRWERAFVLLCEKRRLPIPEPNEPIGRFRPDMLWEGHRLIVELDGPGAHSTPAQLANDAKRQRWLESQGYRVIRFTHDEVTYQPDWVAARVRAALADSV